MKLRYKSNHRELADDELMHYKYVKREQVNGKWRYYYDDDTSRVNTTSKKMAQAKKNMERAAKRVDDLKAEAEKIMGYIEALNNTLTGYLSNGAPQESIQDIQESIRGYTKRYNEVLSKVAQAERDYARAQKIYADAAHEQHEKLRTMSTAPTKNNKKPSAGKSPSSKTTSIGMTAAQSLIKLGVTVASLSKKKGR